MKRKKTKKRKVVPKKEVVENDSALILEKVGILVQF